MALIKISTESEFMDLGYGIPVTAGDEVELMNDLDFEGMTFNYPNWDDIANVNEIMAEFRGSNLTIRNVTMNTNHHASVFGMARDLRIRDLKLENINMLTDGTSAEIEDGYGLMPVAAGVLCMTPDQGSNGYVELINVKCDGNVEIPVGLRDGVAAGILGVHTTGQMGNIRVQECSFAGNIEGFYCGGVLSAKANSYNGYDVQRPSMSRCTNTANLTGNMVAGVGYINGDYSYNSDMLVNRCYNAGHIVAEGDAFGVTTARANNSENGGSIRGVGWAIGISGYNASRCINKGKVKAENQEAYGITKYTADNCSNLNDVECVNSPADAYMIQGSASGMNNFTLETALLNGVEPDFTDTKNGASVSDALTKDEVFYQTVQGLNITRA